MLKIPKLKVAVVLSGTQKFPERSVETINFFDSIYNVKTFCHCWENTKQLNEYNSASVYYEYKDNPAEPHFAKYKNIIYKIEKLDDYIKYFDDLWLKVTNRHSCKNSSYFSMYYSMKQADILRREYEIQNNIKFDCVVRMRFDSIIYKKFKFTSFNLNNINIPIDYQYAFEKPEANKPRGINDQFAFGRSEHMKQYFDCFDNIIQICNSGTYFCPHAILGQHLLNSKIPVDRPNITVNIHNS
jgi:hypothetical protein